MLFSCFLLLSLIVFTGVLSKCDSDQCTYDDDPMSITVWAAANAFKATVPADLSFIHALLIKELLLTSTFDEQLAAKNFVEFYKEHDGIDSNTLAKFKNEYHQHSAIWWYTHPDAIHQLLNEALRAQDVVGMLRMGFFIQRLHRQIEHLAKEADEVKSGFMLYRGQGLSFDDYGKVKEGEGGLLSFNTFLWAQTDREKALASGQRALRDRFDTVVLFSISVEPSATVPPTFVSLNYRSYSKQSENEYLFSLTTVFHVDRVESRAENGGIVIVHLRSITEIAWWARQLIQSALNEIKGSTPIFVLAKLMMRMERYSTAEAIYNQLLNEADEGDLADMESVYDQLGSIHKKNKNFSAALASFERAFEIASRHRLPNDSEFSVILSKMGDVLLQLGLLDAALEKYQEELRLEMQLTVVNPPRQATLYITIAGVFQKQGKYAESMAHYDYALAIQLKQSSHDHLAISLSYLGLASCYSLMENHPKMIAFMEKCLSHQYQVKPVNWKVIAGTHSRISQIFSELNHKDKALYHAQQAVASAARVYPKEDAERQEMEHQLQKLLKEDL